MGTRLKSATVAPL